MSRPESETILTAADRLRAQRLKRIARGLCWFCSKPAAPGSRHQCAEHLKKARVTPTDAKWKPGGRGRPPLWVKDKGELS